ncbi:hypothetical protein [Vibrio parahaemolyticus]|uniref:hypothetical protein n=1 Tax=Vibrio parahaemolyticus TaxID=670 RepID=UPI00111E3C8D|nr:hypothetical protein [Vibrio parahaemolyticus]TOM94447.1 hypothetical protein CGH65_24520 [Vibrio parahaemolyticus]
MSFLILGKTLEQWTFSSDEQVAFLDQWLKADRYKLTTKEFCQSLVENGTDALKKIGQAGLDAPGQGQRFVDVLEGWFPGVVLSSIRAAESAGQRHIGLQTAIEQLKGGENIVAKLVKMLAFPYVLTVGAGFYGVYIADKMLGAIDNQLGIGLTVRNFFADYGIAIAAVFALLLLVLAIALPNWKGNSRALSNDWPLFSLYREAVASTLLKTLANLTQCGMKLSDALVQAEIRNTPFAKAHIQTMREQAIGQTNLGAILDTGLLLPNELSAMKVLGSRVSYTELLSESGQHHSEHVAKQLEKMQLWLPKAGLLVTILVLGSLIASATYQLYLTLI